MRSDRDDASLDSARPLLRETYAAWCTQRSSRAEQLCREHAEEIIAEFADWQSPPESIRRDRPALERYAEFLAWVAQYLDEQCGRPKALERLRGAHGGPLGWWETQAQQVVALGNVGRWKEAIALLWKMRVEVASWSGPGAIRYYATTCDLVGKAFFRAGDPAAAALAMAEAVASWDEAGESDRASDCRETLAYFRKNISSQGKGTRT